MASTATPRGRVELQALGENAGTWGQPKLNNALTRLEEMGHGHVSFSLSGAKTLTATNYAADEARMKVNVITGGTGGTVTVPPVEFVRLVINGSSGNATYTMGSGRTAVVEAGNSIVVRCDGTNCDLVRDVSLATKAELAAAVLDGSLPPQTGKDGKALVTDGDGAVDFTGTVIPDPSGEDDKFVFIVDGEPVLYSLNEVLPAATEGQYLRKGASAWGAANVPGSVAIRTITTSSATAWTKPAGLVFARIVAIGGGGGGGGASSGNNTLDKAGGGGGSGAGYSEGWFAASALPSSLNITIGAGGAGGAGAVSSGPGLNGSAGNPGGFTRVGSGTGILYAVGGLAGNFGLSDGSGGSETSDVTAPGTQITGGGGGRAGRTGGFNGAAASNVNSSAINPVRCPGGGGGGGISTADLAGAGGAGGAGSHRSGSNTGGGAAAGANGDSPLGDVGYGGGGGAAVLGAGQNGGAGGYGAGGGGGGAGRTSGGSGGAGGQGVVYVFEYF